MSLTSREKGIRACIIESTSISLYWVCHKSLTQASVVYISRNLDLNERSEYIIKFAPSSGVLNTAEMPTLPATTKGAFLRKRDVPRVSIHRCDTPFWKVGCSSIQHSLATVYYYYYYYYYY